jgi:plasmid stabilization system protein ParE
VSRFLLTRAAKADLEDISAYVRRRSPDAARRVRARLREAMVRLGHMPQMGHLREDLTSEGLRFWSVYSYLLIYRSDTHPVQIVRVLHGARDIRRILNE